MDAAQFTQYAREDPQLNVLLEEVAEDAQQTVSVEEPQSYVLTGVDILIAIAAYALYRWLKDYFDRSRGLHEVEIARQQEKLIAVLIEDGFKPQDAQAVAVALLDRIAKRGKDDIAFATAASLIKT